MGIRLKVAENAKELDDVFWLRHRVYVIEEDKFGGERRRSWMIVDRFDAHPNCANLIAYEGDEPVATMRINLDSGSGLPVDEYFDFSSERERLENEWLLEAQQAPKFLSAGMLAIRKGWRRRRDVVRALFKLASNVARSWQVTHLLVVVNHENEKMYKRLGYWSLGERFWVESIGNHVHPMAATFSEFYGRTVGTDLDDLELLRCFPNQFQRLVFRAGERIFNERDEANECYVVDTGSVKITTTNAVDGRELSFAVLGAGEVFGELALIDEKPRSADATAMVDTEVIVLRREDFMDGLQSHPEHLEFVLNFISDRLRRTDQFAKLLAYGSPVQRLDFALKGMLESARTKHGEDSTCLLKAGPGDLAAAAGTDEHDATAYLNDLREQGQCEYSDKSIRFLVPMAFRTQ